MACSVATCVPWELFQGRKPCRALAMAPDIPARCQSRKDIPQAMCTALAVTHTVQGACNDVDSVESLIAAMVSTLDSVRCQAEGRQVGTLTTACISARMQGCLQAVLVQLETSGARASVLRRLLSRDVPAKLVTCLGALDFETQKDASRLFAAALRLGMPLGLGSEVAEYVRCRPQITKLLLDGCEVLDVVSQCAEMLRSCTKCPQLVEVLYQEGAAIQLVKLAQHPTFEISSEAFSLLQALLLTQKQASAIHLVANFEEFFSLYNNLLQVEDYVTQRQALRLLSDLLLDVCFMNVMLAYVAQEKYLQIHMNLLRHSSKAIQLDAFHVVKIFVVNPHMPRRVHQILYQNRERLSRLLESLLEAKKYADAALVNDLHSVLDALSVLEVPAKKYSPSTTFSSPASSFVSPINSI